MVSFTHSMLAACSLAQSLPGACLVRSYTAMRKEGSAAPAEPDQDSLTTWENWSEDHFHHESLVAALGVKTDVKSKCTVQARVFCLLQQRLPIGHGSDSFSDAAEGNDI